jgi:hypothetical protein
MTDKAFAEHHEPMAVIEQKLVKRWKGYWQNGGYIEK